MSYRITLAEIESSLRKAARACGLDWGVAEEAGKAARWLAAFNLPGPETTLRHLQNLCGQDYRNFIPDCDLVPWQASGGILCPIITGAALADRSAIMLEGSAIKLGPTAYPLLLAATLGQAARYHRTVFTTCWAGVRVNCFANGLTIAGNNDSLLLPEAPNVCCCREELSEPEQLPATLAYEIDREIYDEIDRLAFQTYAPATEHSRAGAGAGLTDND
ncbi:MAG: DUF3726 domain-containing protein [Gammaproteobacteria bacterium]|nr:MAG: DUF3726 domain-containing protein [Gammaproteobacteria bacterium]